MSSRIRIGIVGFGKIARDQHVEAIAATEGVELVAVASRNARLDGVAHYRDIDAMLAGERDLDAVALCQPPQVRFWAARAAIMAGKHVFLEKPPGATLTEVEALALLAQQRGTTIFASWHSREAAAVRAAREWLTDKAIRSVDISWKEDVRVWHPGQEWIWQAGGFGVFDPGINALSILTAIMPEPVRLTSAYLETPSNRAAPIAATLDMETVSGAGVKAEFDFRQTGPQTWDITVETESGNLLLKEGGNRLILDDVDQACGSESEYSSLYTRFVELVDRRTSDIDLSPMRIVADAFLSGRTQLVEPFEY